ncbi:MAG: hypothetical protein ACJ8FL_03715 [Sphingomicrobium sp.]
MYKSLVALAFSMTIAGCAMTPTAQTAAEECALVDQDATGTHISVRQECKAAPGGAAARAPK